VPSAVVLSLITAARRSDAAETASLLYIPWVYTCGVGQVESKRQARINMRVSERQERVLRAAAELSGETLTGFVLGVATERAEQVLERANRVDLSAEAFDRFVAALDGPAEEMPVVRRYARQRSPIPAP
jgi:uncharacterized protein (DUF1778 family)